MLMTEAREPDARALISAKQSVALKLRRLNARMVDRVGRRVTVNEVLEALLDDANEDSIAARLSR